MRATLLSAANIERFVIIVAFIVLIITMIILQIVNSKRFEPLEYEVFYATEWNQPVMDSGPVRGGSVKGARAVRHRDLGWDFGSDLAIDSEDQSDMMAKVNRQRPRYVQTDEPSDYTGHGGGTYIRWGRKTCPDDMTEAVYKGIAAGSLTSHEGGASNMLCLPNEPTWGQFSDGAQNYAYVYGAEYHDTGLFQKTNAESLTSSHNIPCVVCRSQRYTSAIMIPARTDCLGDWHLEYHGYLMAGAYSHKSATEYICIDEAPESDPAGYRNEDGPNLYRVESICGAIPCPQYVNSRDLACAVCSK